MTVEGPLRVRVLHLNTEGQNSNSHSLFINRLIELIKVTNTPDDLASHIQSTVKATKENPREVEARESRNKDEKK